MYGGQIMEQAGTEALFARPTHPYSKGLLEAVPRLDRDDDVLRTIAGEPPDMSRLPPGCPFSPRCGHVRDQCSRIRPGLVEAEPHHWRACHAPVPEVAA
jgi:oligopeptide transport system ATP-binding protein